MTQKEIYTYGYVYGYLSSLLSAHNVTYDRSGSKFQQGSMYPVRAFVEIHAAAIDKKIIGDVAAKRLAELLDNIHSIDDGPEQCQPLERQGAWQLAYYHAMAGRPYPDDEPDVAALRKAKGLTQKQLADLVGCDQAMISRLEAGKGPAELRDKVLDELK